MFLPHINVQLSGSCVFICFYVDRFIWVFKNITVIKNSPTTAPETRLQRLIQRRWSDRFLNQWRENCENSISPTSERSEWEMEWFVMEVTKKKWPSIVAPFDMNYGRKQIFPDYGYRVDKVKHNLQIKVHNPSIDRGIYNFVVSTRSEAIFPSAVVGQSIVCTLCKT